MTYGNSRKGIEEFRAKVVEEAVVPPYVINDFATETGRKLDHGDAKYGPDAWAQHDMLAEAIDETIDLGNYAYLTWRQLREVPCTSQITILMESMVEMYAACLPFYANLRALIQMRDDGKVPKSLTAEDFVGVQPHEPGEPARLS